MLDVSIIKCLSDNYSYLIRDKKTNLVGVVDPSEFNAVDLKISKTYKKLDFILTVSDGGYINGNPSFPAADKFCKVVVILCRKLKFNSFHLIRVIFNPEVFFLN